MFTVDGMEWAIPCDITRKAEITPSDISGPMLDRSYFKDVLGTYMQYEVSIVPNPHDMGAYYSLFELLSQPVDGHTFVLPYNGETIQLTARVDEISDIYVRMPGGGVYWRGTKFTITANAPTKAITLEEAIQRGLTPLPDVYDPQIGDTYIYTADGWVEESTVTDADTTSY